MQPARQHEGNAHRPVETIAKQPEVLPHREVVDLRGHTGEEEIQRRNRHHASETHSIHGIQLFFYIFLIPVLVSFWWW